MAETIERLVATLEADIRGFTKGMEQAQRQFDARASAIERRQSAMMGRLNRSFEAPQLNSLINRYLRWGIIIGTLSRAMRDQAKTDTEAARAMAELERAWNAWAAIAADVLSPLLSMTGKLLQNIAAITRELLNANASGAWRKFAEATSVNTANMTEAQRRGFERMGLLKPGEQIRTGGIPFASAGNIPESVAVTPGKAAAFPTNDRLRAAEDALEAAIEYGERLAREDRERTAERIRLENEYWDEALRLALDYGDQLAEEDRRRVAERIEDDNRARQDMQQRMQELADLEADKIAGRIASIGDAFEYVARAAGDGADAFERALRDMVASLAASGLRNLLESLLGGLAAGGGFIGNLIAGREHGGSVQAGRAYVVGEKRPELFVPSTSGTIIPRIPDAVMAGKAITMTFVNRNSFAGAVDANSIKAYADQVGVVSANAAISAMKRQFPSLMIKSSRDNL